MRRTVLFGLLVASVGATVIAPARASQRQGPEVRDARSLGIKIAAAGDIACPTNTVGPKSCHHQATSDLLVGLLPEGLVGVLPLGDLQYENGELQNFAQYYGPTWGRLHAISYPVPGNHEYGTPAAAGYHAFWGPRPFTALPYYSFDIGAWHFIALNSNCTAVEVRGCGPGSPQEQWLRADLAAHPVPCTLAYWHHPRFSSAGGGKTYLALWDALYEHNADVVLAGHNHFYERFAPQTPTGNADAAKGIRQFTVGTGGASHDSPSGTAPNSQVRNSTTFGVLELTLQPTGYDWRFVPEAGATFRDRGSDSCH